MKTKITNYLMLLSGVVFLLAACDPPETKTPEPTENQITFDGQSYIITNAGTDFEGAVNLYFESEGDDAGAWFALRLGEGEFAITKSTTFTFASGESDDYGKPGTFSEGGFKKGTMEAGVTSGTIKINSADGVYDIEIDCVCEGGRKLTVNYSGQLEFDEPLGTTTFNIGGSLFPYAYAEMYSDGWNENYDSYITEIVIMAFDATGNRILDCELGLFHSLPGVAGTYDGMMDESYPGAGMFYGELYIDDYDSEDDDLGGIMIEGEVKVEIAGDIYTITLEGVKLYSGDDNDLIDVTGTYTGRIIDAIY